MIFENVLSGGIVVNFNSSSINLQCRVNKCFLLDANKVISAMTSICKSMLDLNLYFFMSFVMMPLVLAWRFKLALSPQHEA